MKKETKKLIKNEFKSLLELGAAVVLAVLTFWLGILWNFGKPFYDFRKSKFKDIMKEFGLYWLRLLYQVWNVIKFFFHQTAIAIDLLGNVIIGDLIEDLVTYKEKTWYGNGRVTISAATGQLEHYGKLNKLGMWFTRQLDKAFNETNHSLNAYEKEKEEIRRMEEIEKAEENATENNS